MKCPLCGKQHQYQHTAQQCFEKIINSLDMRIIANNKLSPKEAQLKKIAKKYYHNLPIHPKFKKMMQGTL
jgi:UDP-N-acetylglucosamine pyrophosphorylase